MEYHLLDDLAKLAQIHYVSELKEKNFTKVYINYIQGLPVHNYSLNDWKDACEYLLNDSKHIETAEMAKECILNWLQS